MVLEDLDKPSSNEKVLDQDQGFSGAAYLSVRRRESPQHVTARAATVFPPMGRLLGDAQSVGFDGEVTGFKILRFNLVFDSLAVEHILNQRP